jgi:hypothetical protein
LDEINFVQHFPAAPAAHPRAGTEKRLVSESILPKLELDISDNDIPRAVEKNRYFIWEKMPPMYQNMWWCRKIPPKFQRIFGY